MSKGNRNSQIKPICQAVRVARWYPLPNMGAIFYSGLVISLLNLDRQDRILDAGCGTGHLTYLLAPRVAKTVGIDISQPTMELINAKVGMKKLINRRLEYHCKDICEPDFGEQYREAFTKVFSIHVLEHVSDPARFVRSLAQCLRPGGSMMIVFPNSRNHGRNFFNQAGEVRDLFVYCEFSPMLYTMSGTCMRKGIAKAYYSLRNFYRMVRKESHFSSSNEFHETRYYATLKTTHFSRLALSIVIGVLQPLASQAALYRLKPL